MLSAERRGVGVGQQRAVRARTPATHLVETLVAPALHDPPRAVRASLEEACYPTKLTVAQAVGHVDKGPRRALPLAQATCSRTARGWTELSLIL